MENSACMQEYFREKDKGMEPAPKGNTERNLLELLNKDNRSRHEFLALAKFMTVTVNGKFSKSTE